MNSVNQVSKSCVRENVRFTYIFFIVTVLLATTATFASAKKATYIVHLEEPDAGFGSLGLFERSRWYSSFFVGGNVAAERSLVYGYQHIMTGFAARLTKAEVKAMQKLRGFVAAYPDHRVPLHTSYSYEFLGLSPNQGLWPRTEYGKGVIIGVLDTGVWPEHASFSDDGIPPPPPKWNGICQTAPNFTVSNCNNKLIGARVFDSGASASGDTTPRDSNGHGTHTSSTAAGFSVPGANLFGYANGTAYGMATYAHVAMYKVFRHTCYSSDILAGMDQAVADGVDVLSISLGGSFAPFYRNHIAIGAFHATARGIFVSCSAGNDGPDHSTLSNQAPWIMTVGASTMDRNFIATVKLGDGRSFYGESLYPAQGPTQSLPLVYVSTQSGKLCLKGSLNSSLVAGKIVLCETGVSRRAAKGQVVKAAGGLGMIFAGREDRGVEIIANAHVLPTTNVDYKAGVAIKAYIDSVETPTASFDFQGTFYGTTNAPAVAAFSSRGPSTASPSILKPDVIGPGVNILAAWPADVSPTRLPEDERRVKFNVISGTSMSCPHVSGLAALIKADHPEWSPAAVKSALMTTAYVVDNRGEPILDAATNDTADIFATGAGHVNPEKAANPGLIYDLTPDDYIPYLCGLNFTLKQIHTIVNKNVTCPSGEITNPGNLNYPSFSALFPVAKAPVSTTFKRTVTNVGPAISTYNVSIEAPPGVDVSVSPTLLSFTQVMEKKSYNVTITVPVPEAHSFVQGSITWLFNTTSYSYQVRSPISISWYA